MDAIWYLPTIPAKPKVVTIVVNALFGDAIPRAVMQPTNNRLNQIYSLSSYILTSFCHLFESQQCFDAVGWAAGRASGL